MSADSRSPIPAVRPVLAAYARGVAALMLATTALIPAGPGVRAQSPTNASGAAASADASTNASAAASVPADAAEFVRYWEHGGMPLWFGKDPELDRALRDRYLPLHERAARGDLAGWRETPTGALALVLLLDQFPRNAFRGARRMYATDALARHVADGAIRRDFQRHVPVELRRFFALPFAHSESLADQERAVALARELSPHDAERAEHHRAIVQRFGRFPHRNAILGRASTAEELRYLAEGGYGG